MPDVRVTDLETGEESFVPSESFDPTTHELVPDQVATVTPLGDPGEFPVGQAITPRALAGLLPEVTPEAREELTAEQVQEQFDTTINTAKQAARGAAAGLTFGASELLLRSEDPFARERARREREAGGSAFIAGEIAGAIVPGLLTGGAGFGATLARLAPSARVAAVTGRVAARGTGALGKVASSALGNAIEAAAQNVGATIAREALNDDPTLSAEVLLISAGQGAALGGGFGAVAAGIGAGARRLRAIAQAPEAVAGAARGASRAAAPTPLVQRRALDAMFGGAVRPSRQRRAVLRSQARAAGPAPTPGVEEIGGQLPATGRRVSSTARFEEFVSRRAQADTGKRLGRLISHVDDSAQASLGATRREIPDFARRLDGAGVDRVLRAELVGDLTRLSEEFGTASVAASRWMARVTGEIGADSLAKLTPAQVLKRLPDQLEDDAAVVLADLDSARSAYTAARTRADAALQGALDAPVGAQAVPGGITQRIRARLGAGGIADTAATVAGAAELARSAGVDVPLPSVRDIPGIGDAMALYVQFKAGANAAKRIGVLPASPATAAASRVNSVRDRLSAAVDRASRGVLRVAGTTTAQRLIALSASAVTQRIADLRSATPQQVEAEAATTVGVDPALSAVAGATARRAHEYLLSQAPTNPLAGTALADGWSPSPVQLIEWGTTSAAVADPVAAIERSFTAPFPDLAIDAVRTVYPGLYAQLQADLFAQRDKLRDKLPEHRLEALGRAYAVPLTTSQLPEYRAIPAAPTAPIAPAGPAPTPKGSTTSPVGTLELTGDASRQLRR